MMIPGAAIAGGGRRSEKIESEDSLRTVECLRGRLLAERAASRNAKEEAELMENKLIELEKKLKEENKSRKRAEKKLKFLLKKLESLNISYVSDESVSLEKSEISSIISLSSSSSRTAKENADKEINPIFDIQEECLENLQQQHASFVGGACDFQQLSIQKEEIEEFQIGSNKYDQNACCSNNHYESIICSSDDEIKELEEMSNSPIVLSDKSEPNAATAALSAINHLDNPPAAAAAKEGVDSRNGTNFPKLEEIEEPKEKKTESPTISTKSEPNAVGLSSINLDTPPAATAIEVPESRNGSNFTKLTKKKEEIAFEFEEPKEEKKTEFPTIMNKSEPNASLSAKNLENPSRTEKKEEEEEEIEELKEGKKTENPASTLETFSLVEEAHSAKSNESESSQKAKKSNKDDRSLRSLFKKEKLNENKEKQDDDDQVDNSLALVPVDLPKTEEKSIVDPVILDASVKQVLDALRKAKEKLQTSMERRRNSTSNMIQVG